MRGPLLLVFLIVGPLPAAAQESLNFKLQEFVFDAGGHPADGTILSSASFRVTLDAIGEGTAATTMSGSSFQVEGGLVPAYPPPDEVQDIRFSGKDMFCWAPERSGGAYNVYRDPTGVLPGNFGTCSQLDLATECATDSNAPPAGEAWFYLATAENRIGEEGTKGYRSSGVERSNLAPCP